MLKLKKNRTNWGTGRSRCEDRSKIHTVDKEKVSGAGSVFVGSGQFNVVLRTVIAAKDYCAPSSASCRGRLFRIQSKCSTIGKILLRATSVLEKTGGIMRLLRNR